MAATQIEAKLAIKPMMIGSGKLEIMGQKAVTMLPESIAAHAIA